MTAALKPPIPYYGGKQLLADRIVALLPTHEQYVEPYAGSLAVLLAKPRATSEAINDLDGDLVNFWHVLREQPDELTRICALTPHSRTEHTKAMEAIDQPPSDPLERARQTWVLLTQGRSGGTGRRTGWRYFSTAASYSMPKYLDSYVDRICPAAARLVGVSLECRPALEVIDTYGKHANTLLYVDPPYVRSTRKGTGYRHEMTDQDHRDLAVALNKCDAAVVLSGYASPIYDLELYPNWDRLEVAAGTGNGGEWRDRTEVLWSNRPFGTHPTLFDGGAA